MEGVRRRPTGVFGGCRGEGTCLVDAVGSGADPGGADGGECWLRGAETGGHWWPVGEQSRGG